MLNIFKNRKYVIVNISDITDEMLEKSMENKALAKSSDNKTILKWNGDTPTVFSGMTTYNHSEILIELAKDIWITEEN